MGVSGTVYFDTDPLVIGSQYAAVVLMDRSRGLNTVPLFFDLPMSHGAA
jgi:hypothetical protein